MESPLIMIFDKLNVLGCRVSPIYNSRFESQWRRAKA